jgi:hypothetical protein
LIILADGTKARTRRTKWGWDVPVVPEIARRGWVGVVYTYVGKDGGQGTRRVLEGRDRDAVSEKDVRGNWEAEEMV